ncbi:hypothetical protein SALBM135S_02142 [Streptomyces alboniger]
MLRGSRCAAAGRERGGQWDVSGERKTRGHQRDGRRGPAHDRAVARRLTSPSSAASPLHVSPASRPPPSGNSHAYVPQPHHRLAAAGAAALALSLTACGAGRLRREGGRTVGSDRRGRPRRAGRQVRGGHGGRGRAEGRWRRGRRGDHRLARQDHRDRRKHRDREDREGPRRHRGRHARLHHRGRADQRRPPQRPALHPHRPDREEHRPTLPPERLPGDPVPGEPPRARSPRASPPRPCQGRRPAYAMVRVSNGGGRQPAVSGFSVTLQGGGGMASVTAPGAGAASRGPGGLEDRLRTCERRNGGPSERRRARRARAFDSSAPSSVPNT